jgi:hypothetical protein
MESEEKRMRVIIAGSRHITDSSLLEEAIKESGFEIDLVLCGEARGVDTMGKEWANRNGIEVESYEAEWGKYRLAAGPIRNKKMAKNADALILLWDGKSGGSANMLREAKISKLKIHQKVI